MKVKKLRKEDVVDKDFDQKVKQVSRGGIAGLYRTAQSAEPLPSTATQKQKQKQSQSRIKFMLKAIHSRNQI